VSVLARLLLTLAFTLAPQVADAATVGTVIPPSNPGENQYVEDVPTAGGPTAGGGYAGSVVVPGATTGAPSERLARSTLVRLARLGPAGNRTAGLAQAAASPRTVEHRTNRRPAHHRHLVAAHGSAGGSSGGASPASTVLSSIFGGQGALALGLPFAIVATTLAAGLIALRSRRAR
jgi:hypothetical protein